MVKIFLVTLILIGNSLFLQALPITNATKLVHVSLLFRHGNRMPLYFLPNDPVNPSYWNKYGGPGEITTKGLKVEYDLGVNLRKYYTGFLNETYSSARVRVRSTDVDRTLMSAQAVMAGLYKPSSVQAWNSELNWFPIPIHTEPFETDKLFPANSPCPPFDALIRESLASSENLDFIKANEETYKKAAALSGLNMTTMDPNIMMIRIVDTIICEIADGLQVAPWAKENFEKFREIMNFAFQRDFRTTKMAKFYSGTQLNEIRNNLIKKANESLSNELSVYSTHDTMLAALVKLLDLNVPRMQPPFGSAIMFELRQDASQNYYVRVVTKMNWIDEPTVFQEVYLKECGQILCPLDKFLEITSDKIVDDFNKECGIPSA